MSSILTCLLFSFSVALQTNKQSYIDNIYSTSFRSKRFLFRWYTNIEKVNAVGKLSWRVQSLETKRIVTINDDYESIIMRVMMINGDDDDAIVNEVFGRGVNCVT